MSEEDERGAAGWVLLAALLGYSLFCHQGLGLPKANAPMAWYLPTGFLNGWPVIGELSEDWRIGALILLVPAGLLATGVFLKTASAVARALAVSSVVAVLLFSFYGFSEADRIWEFFHWRGSIVFAGTALAIGFTIAAPLLAKSWLRLGWKGRSLSYLPLAFAIIALERHATGWDEDLFFNFSPWPALPVLGFEYGAFIPIGILFGVALADGHLRDLGIGTRGDRHLRRHLLYGGAANPRNRRAHGARRQQWQGAGTGAQGGSVDGADWNRDRCGRCSDSHATSGGNFVRRKRNRPGDVRGPCGVPHVSAVTLLR